MSTTSRNKGFTLLEILITLMLLATLGGALYGTYFGLMKSREKATDGMEQLRDARSALDSLRREIAAAYYTKSNVKLHFIVEDRDLFGKPSSTLDFTTATTPLSGPVPSSDLVAVRYEPRERDGAMLMTREEKDVFLEAAASPYPWIEQLEGFLVECYDGSRWVKSWDTALNNGLPEAVRVTLTIKEGGRISRFSTITVPRARET